uniref:Uncharacterized protein n=1 Tax=Crocodylus porosus TaxID=8502 RepID=A0A7M4F8V8_CROPO
MKSIDSPYWGQVPLHFSRLTMFPLFDLAHYVASALGLRDPALWDMPSSQWDLCLSRGCMWVRVHPLSVMVHPLQKGAADTVSGACEQSPLATPLPTPWAASAGGL